MKEEHTNTDWRLLEYISEPHWDLPLENVGAGNFRVINSGDQIVFHVLYAIS